MILAGPEPAAVAGAVGAAAVGALVVAALAHLLLLRLGRRSEVMIDLAQRVRQPTRVTLVLAAVLGALDGVRPTGGWVGPVEHLLLVALIAAVAWLVGALSFVVGDAALHRYRTDVPDNRHARKVRTQVTMIRRVTVALLAAIAAGAALMTFPAARAAGASLLASAGIAGVVAGLAAQTTLGNVFAGVQLAFSEWLRLDDVVVVEGEWGRVEDITLSYVVVHVWDDRRLVFPTSYFTTRPFQNWTRNEAALLGTVELDVDWTVPVEAMREELHRILQGTELWDGRVSVLQVTDAVGGSVRLRALVSARDAPTDWDLRCLVREQLVAWLQEREAGALPRTRVDVSPPSRSERAPGTAAGGRPDRGASVFSGSADGEERAAAFTRGNGEDGGRTDAPAADPGAVAGSSAASARRRAGRSGPPAGGSGRSRPDSPG